MVDYELQPSYQAYGAGMNTFSRFDTKDAKPPSPYWRYILVDPVAYQVWQYCAKLLVRQVVIVFIALRSLHTVIASFLRLQIKLKFGTSALYDVDTVVAIFLVICVFGALDILGSGAWWLIRIALLPADICERFVTKRWKYRSSHDRVVPGIITGLLTFVSTWIMFHVSISILEAIW